MLRRALRTAGLAIDRGFRRIVPGSWRQAGKTALWRLLNPHKEVPRVLTSRTGVTTLVTDTKVGLVAFDVRDRGVGWTIAFDREWEPTVSAFVREVLRPGDVAIDVGANIGWYTLLFAELAGDAGTVLAFEPDPRNHALLTESIRLNRRERRVRAFATALWSSDSTLEFEHSEQNFGDHRVRAGDGGAATANAYAEASRRVTRVQARALDGVLDEAALGSAAIRLMKIDAQGAEPAILQGAERALARTAYLALEYWPYGIRRTGADPAEMLARLARHFDEFLVLDGSGRAFRPVADLAAAAATVPDYADIVVRHRSRAR